MPYHAGLMKSRGDIRRLAMQVLYQIDLRGEADLYGMEQLGDDFDDAETRGAGMALAHAAWIDHSRADAMVAELTPDWPTHRQPPVDRAILRLAFHEMVSGHAPPKVAINEAVSLAKDYCGQNSPAFINGVLDKLARKLREQNLMPDVSPQKSSAGPANADAWLADATDQDKPDEDRSGGDKVE